ncbi:hypothetical protein HMPREF0016_02833 [Acinetobacter johnsonii SH046]|jgi:hypothetical protein|uniref:DUF4236 domain-containing protein n=1 Tax=Acinetobacter johnsonii SH046 TaxID=575586 RepID=D0SG60_ACIJO|nr:hypothetical protein HMPREF0016_02833 [Acinetobacter johnsonii SH046]
MGFRFRKSIKILPGLKINLTHKGISSASIGKPGASLNIGKKGARTSVGIPGTGLSYSKHQPYKKRVGNQKILLRNSNRSIDHILSNPNRMSGFG